MADDAIGGFFAINGGALGDDLGAMYYYALDTLEWDSLYVAHAGFTARTFTKDLRQFYAQTRWDGWQEDARCLPGDPCFNFFPLLFTEEGSIQTS